MPAKLTLFFAFYEASLKLLMVNTLFRIIIFFGFYLLVLKYVNCPKIEVGEKGCHFEHFFVSFDKMKLTFELFGKKFALF